MKKIFKCLSFLMLLIPSIFLFSACKDKKEPAVKSYAFSVTTEDGVKLTDAKGKNLTTIKKLETEGNSTYYIQVRNDKDAENLKLFLNGSEVETTLTKVASYNDEIVDAVNYQKVYSFVVPKVTKNTTIKVEGSTDKLITFEFDVLEGDGHYTADGQAIANNVKLELYDEDYDHLEFNHLSTSTLRDFIDNNQKLTIPYSKIIDGTPFNAIDEISVLRLYIAEGNSFYSTTIDDGSVKYNYYSPFKIVNFNTNTPITSREILASGQGSAYGLSAVTGKQDNNFLSLNLGNLKSQNLLKKTNVYKISFKDSHLSDYSIQTRTGTNGNALYQFLTISSTENDVDSKLTHSYMVETTVKLTLDVEKITKAFGSSTDFINSIKIFFEDMETPICTGADFEDGVYSFVIEANRTPVSGAIFLIQYEMEDTVAYSFNKIPILNNEGDSASTLALKEKIRQGITLSATIGAENVSTAVHYMGYETKVTVTVDKTLLSDAELANLTITFNGAEITFNEDGVFTTTLATDQTPAGNANNFQLRVTIK